MRQLVWRIALSVTAETALHEDLCQEGLVHLWLQEAERPGQTRSWYLQSCRYHLLTLLHQGRSVDSWKRQYKRFPLADPLWREDGLIPSPEGAEPESSSLAAKEILGQLAPRLTPAERTILACLGEGCSVDEIAVRTHCSHQCVTKHRKRIALVAMRLGFAPGPLMKHARAVR